MPIAVAGAIEIKGVKPGTVGQELEPGFEPVVIRVILRIMRYPIAISKVTVGGVVAFRDRLINSRASASPTYPCMHLG